MQNPPHPGEVLRKTLSRPWGLSVTEATEALGVSRKTLSFILNDGAGISPEMAIRLAKTFDTSPESWLNQQQQFDLWQAMNSGKEIKVKRFRAAKQIDVNTPAKNT